MITKRDQLILSAIDRFGALATSHVQRMFFEQPILNHRGNISPTFCRVVLNKLHKMQELRKYKGKHIDSQNIWFIGNRPKQLDHRLLTVEAYIRLGCPPIFYPEFTAGNLRADAYAEIRRPGKRYILLVEIHRHGQFDYYKYENFYKSGQWQAHFSHTFPRVVIVSDIAVKLPEKTAIRYFVINSKFDDVEKVFE